METLDQIIKECLDEFELYKKENSHYLAAAVKGEILTAISGKSNAFRYKWQSRFNEADLDAKIFHKIELDVEDGVDHIRRILARPRIHIYENLVFVLTTRIGIEYIRKYLSEHGRGELETDFDQLDKEIGHIKRVKEAGKEYMSAVRSIKKHSRLPIDDDFLVNLLH